MAYQPRIEVFRPLYRDQVIELIDHVLKELQVIPDTDEMIDDEDLFRIPQVYSGRGSFWVAVEEEHVIGTVAIRELDAVTAKLNRMFVQSRYYGRGIGQALFDHALAFASSQQFEAVILNTHVNMTRAHRFYEKNGFVCVAAEPDKYHYRKALQPPRNLDGDSE